MFVFKYYVMDLSDECMSASFIQFSCKHVTNVSIGGILGVKLLEVLKI